MYTYTVRMIPEWHSGDRDDVVDCLPFTFQYTVLKLKI